MNQKVEELRKRIRLTDKEIHKATPEIVHFFQYEEIYPLLEAQLNKVLNDPDLALIDRDERYGDSKYWVKLDDGYWHPIIPLAEALKEAQDEAAG